jgi:hypothetical protein
MNKLDENNNQMGDKRTIIAIVLSVVVISVGFFLQASLFPTATSPAQGAQPTNTTTAQNPPYCRADRGLAHDRRSERRAAVYDIHRPSRSGYHQQGRRYRFPKTEEAPR